MLNRRIIACCSVLMLAAIAPAKLLMAAPIIIAGGGLDPAMPQTDVYLGTPAPAAVPPVRACVLAGTYVEYVNAGRFAEMANLFTADAPLLEPTRQNVRGTAAIAQFYAKTIGAIRPNLIAVFYSGDDHDCMVELATRNIVGGIPRYRLASVDHFTVNASGKATRMIAFARPAGTVAFVLPTPP